MPKAAGTVYRYGTNQPIANASVKAVKESNVLHTTTDEFGDFSFDSLDPGKWRFAVLHEGSLRSQPTEIELVQDETGIRFELHRQQEAEDAAKGRNFFIILLVLLGALVVFYFALHLIFPGTREPVSATLPALISQAEEQIAEAEKISTDDTLDETIGDIKTGVETVLEESPDLNAADKQILESALAELEEAIAADGKDETLRRLAKLRRLLATQSPAGFALWGRDPWRFLEVLLWGLAGVLVYKIIISGWYLRSQRFYREGIVMHIAHIVTTPLLVLVTVLLLSLVTLRFTLASSNEITLDLSDPRILVAFSFLLGTSPWPLWNFIEETAKRVTRQEE